MTRGVESGSTSTRQKWEKISVILSLFTLYFHCSIFIFFIGTMDIGQVACTAVAAAEATAPPRQTGSLGGRRRSLSSHKRRASARKR